MAKYNYTAQVDCKKGNVINSKQLSFITDEKSFENTFDIKKLNAIDNCRNISCWENKLNNNRPTGVTTSELNRLFDYVHYVRQYRLESPCN